MIAADQGVARRWGRLIYDLLRTNASRTYTYAQIQEILGTPPGSTFNTAMLHARRAARTVGDCIAFCWRDGDELVLTCNPTDDQLAASIARRGKAINGQVVNFVDQLEWGARNATDPVLRRYCSQAARAHTGAAMMSQALSGMAEDMITRITDESPAA